PPGRLPLRGPKDRPLLRQAQRLGKGQETMKTMRRTYGLGSIGFGLLLATLSGCQTQVAGMTLPSGHYLKHPPQYFAPDPDFPLQRELAAMQEQAAGLPAAGAAALPPGPVVPPPGAVPAPLPAPPVPPPRSAAAAELPRATSALARGSRLDIGDSPRRSHFRTSPHRKIAGTFPPELVFDPVRTGDATRITEIGVDYRYVWIVKAA